MASPVSLRTSCASKHKKARDCKNVSAVCNASGKTSDEKKAEHAKNDEDCDQSRKCTSPATAKQSNGEKSIDAECNSPKLEAPVSPLNQKENISCFKKLKGKNDEHLSQDCKNADTVEKDSCDSKNDSANILENLQDKVSKDKNPMGSNIKNKGETQA